MGPKKPRGTVLSPMEEAAIVAPRVQTRLPLDDVYIALKNVIPHLTRSALHRCLQRHGISRLPKADREKPKRFKAYEIGCFHIDTAELRRHIRDWLVAYNLARQLKALRFKTPYEAIEQVWKSKPEAFIVKPHHHMLGLNT